MEVSHPDSDYHRKHVKRSYTCTHQKSKKRDDETIRRITRNSPKKNKPTPEPKERKPWKVLLDVDKLPPSISNSSPAYVSNNDAEPPQFISPDLLNEVLTGGPSMDVKHLWDNPTDNSNGVWDFQCGAEGGLQTVENGDKICLPLPLRYDSGEKEVVDECAAVKRDDCLLGAAGEEEHREVIPLYYNEGSEDYYQEIEQSLANMSMCEEMSDGCEKSKLLPMFRDNPFSYMLQHGDFTSMAQDERETLQPNQSLTCKHCQETYEISLDLELDEQKEFPGVLGLVDSRLNFDWCKYHPPPSWYPTTGDNGDAAIHGNNETSSGCDCEFCRSRIWRRACKSCGTPQ